MDDTAYIATAETMEEAATKLKDMMERRRGAFEWADSHNCSFAVDKFALIGFTRAKKKVAARRRPRTKAEARQTGNKEKKHEYQLLERPSIALRGTQIKPSKSHKFLGMVIDQELNFKEHAAMALAKGMKWVSQFRRLARPSKGVSAKFMRQFYTSVAIPRMLYGVDVFMTPPSSEARGQTGIIAKLARVQRQAAIHITGAMRTTATDTLNAHADLMPFELLIDKKCHDEATRLATLPREHPLYQLTRTAARPVLRTPDRSPMHRLIHDAFSIQPDEYETIKTIRFDPKWASRIRTRIAPNKEAAADEDQDNTDSIKVYSDGSLIEGGVGAAAVLYRRGREMGTLHKHLGKSTQHTVYEAELTGIILALQLIINSPPSRSASIALDNVAAIRATELTSSAPGSYLIDEIHKIIQNEFDAKGRTRPTIRWVPGHSEIAGNERSDVEAKEAAKGRTSEEARLPQAMRRQLPTSRSAARQAFNEELKKRWRKGLEQSPRWPKIRSIDSTAPSHNFRKITSHLPRRHVAILTQLRTGHAPLQRHMHHIRPDEFVDATCPACGQREETVQHYLLQCRKYADSRHRLEQAVGRAGRDLSKLLTNKAMFEHLFTFINETQRFKATFGDVNVPKTSETELDDPGNMRRGERRTRGTRAPNRPTQSRNAERSIRTHRHNNDAERTSGKPPPCIKL